MCLNQIISITLARFHCFAVIVCAQAFNDHHQTLPFALYWKDGYCLNVVAPNHLITRLFKEILTIIFLELLDNKNKDRLQIFLKSTISKYGFQSQSVLFKTKKHKLVPRLSIYTLYFLLTFLPSILQSIDLLEKYPAGQILINLYRFFSLSFWWPSNKCDGSEAWTYMHSFQMSSYHPSLKLLEKNFIKSIDKFSRS